MELTEIFDQLLSESKYEKPLSVNTLYHDPYSKIQLIKDPRKENIYWLNIAQNDLGCFVFSFDVSLNPILEQLVNVLLSYDVDSLVTTTVSSTYQQYDITKVNKAHLLGDLIFKRHIKTFFHDYNTNNLINKLIYEQKNNGINVDLDNGLIPKDSLKRPSDVFMGGFEFLVEFLDSLSDKIDDVLTSHYEHIKVLLALIFLSSLFMGSKLTIQFVIDLFFKRYYNELHVFNSFVNTLIQKLKKDDTWAKELKSELDSLTYDKYSTIDVMSNTIIKEFINSLIIVYDRLKDLKLKQIQHADLYKANVAYILWAATVFGRILTPKRFNAKHINYYIKALLRSDRVKTLPKPLYTEESKLRPQYNLWSIGFVVSPSLFVRPQTNETILTEVFEQVAINDDYLAMLLETIETTHQALANLRTQNIDTIRDYIKDFADSNWDITKCFNDNTPHKRVWSVVKKHIATIRKQFPVPDNVELLKSEERNVTEEGLFQYTVIGAMLKVTHPVLQSRPFAPYIAQPAIDLMFQDVSELNNNLYGLCNYVLYTITDKRTIGNDTILVTGYDMYLSYLINCFPVIEYTIDKLVRSVKTHSTRVINNEPRNDAVTLPSLELSLTSVDNLIRRGVLKQRHWAQDLYFANQVKHRPHIALAQIADVIQLARLLEEFIYKRKQWRFTSPPEEYTIHSDPLTSAVLQLKLAKHIGFRNPGQYTGLDINDLWKLRALILEDSDLDVLTETVVKTYNYLSSVHQEKINDQYIKPFRECINQLYYESLLAENKLWLLNKHKLSGINKQIRTILNRIARFVKKGAKGLNESGIPIAIRRKFLEWYSKPENRELFELITSTTKTRDSSADDQQLIDTFVIDSPHIQTLDVSKIGKQQRISMLHLHKILDEDLVKTIIKHAVKTSLPKNVSSDALSKTDPYDFYNAIRSLPKQISTRGQYLVSIIQEYSPVLYDYLRNHNDICEIISKIMADMSLEQMMTTLPGLFNHLVRIKEASYKVYPLFVDKKRRHVLIKPQDKNKVVKPDTKTLLEQFILLWERHQDIQRQFSLNDVLSSA